VIVLQCLSLRWGQTAGVLSQKYNCPVPDIYFAELGTLASEAICLDEPWIKDGPHEFCIRSKVACSPNR
jgi:hypothetical protein